MIHIFATINARRFDIIYIEIGIVQVQVIVRRSLAILGILCP
jgi:hypothetical protein